MAWLRQRAGTACSAQAVADTPRRAARGRRRQPVSGSAPCPCTAGPRRCPALRAQPPRRRSPPPEAARCPLPSPSLRKQRSRQQRRDAEASDGARAAPAPRAAAPLAASARAPRRYARHSAARRAAPLLKDGPQAEPCEAKRAAARARWMRVAAPLRRKQRRRRRTRLEWRKPPRHRSQVSGICTPSGLPLCCEAARHPAPPASHQHRVSRSSPRCPRPGPGCAAPASRRPARPGSAARTSPPARTPRRR